MASTRRCGYECPEAALWDKAPYLKQRARGALLGDEHGEEFVPREFAGAERGEVRRELLDVDPRGAARTEVFNEVKDGELGGIVDAVKHAFAGEDAAGRHAVEAADEVIGVPDLDAVRVTAPVQLEVGGDHRGCDPRAMLSGTRCVGAGVNDGVEGRIDCETQARGGALGAAEVFGNVQRGKFQDGAARRTDPGDDAGKRRVGPGKDAAAVGGNEAIGVEVTVQRDETQRIVGIGWQPEMIGGGHRRAAHERRRNASRETVARQRPPGVKPQSKHYGYSRGGGGRMQERFCAGNIPCARRLGLPSFPTFAHETGFFRA